MSHRSRASLAVQRVATSSVYWRQPTDPERDTPQAVKDALRVYGGTNPYGEPLWRVILAGAHLVQRSGEWRTTRPGEDQVEFTPGRNGALDYVNRELKPMRVVHGTRWIPMYPCDGWILERWFPGHCFGTPAAWEAVKSFDGTPMMGPYPSRGDYWMMKGPWDTMPSLAETRRGIASWENSTKHMHGKIDQALFDATMANFMKLLDEMDEQQYLRVLGQAKQMRTETMRDWMTNPRLTGERNRILNARGVRGHV